MTYQPHYPWCHYSGWSLVNLEKSVQGIPPTESPIKHQLSFELWFSLGTFCIWIIYRRTYIFSQFTKFTSKVVQYIIQNFNKISHYILSWIIVLFRKKCDNMCLHLVKLLTHLSLCCTFIVRKQNCPRGNGTQVVSVKVIPSCSNGVLLMMAQDLFWCITLCVYCVLRYQTCIYNFCY